MLGDRWGPGRVYLALQLWRALGYAAFALVAGFSGFLVVASAIEVGDAALPAISQSVVGPAEGESERVATLARVRAVRNLGFGLGAAAATGVLAIGSRPAFLALILVNAGAILLSALLLHRAGIASLKTAAFAVVRRRFGPIRDASYLAAALLNGILSVSPRVRWRHRNLEESRKMAAQRKYPVELRVRATRLAVEARRDPTARLGVFKRIGDQLGVHPEALRTWVKQAEVDQGLVPGTTSADAARIVELERENRELRRANQILKSAASFFAAELDRPTR